MTASPAFRILVVDENPAVRLFVDLAVGSDGVRVDGATHSHAAMASVDRTPPNLVLAATGMTGLGAHDLAARLSSRNVPLVLMKGSLEPASSHQWQAAGVLAKPLELAALRDLVARIAAGEPLPLAVLSPPMVTDRPDRPTRVGPPPEPPLPTVVDTDVIDAWMNGADSALGLVPPRWRRLAADGEILHSFANDLAAFRAGDASGYRKRSSRTSTTTPRRTATTRSPTM
jgi:CheY-like chemotaxis protein